MKGKTYKNQRIEHLNTVENPSPWQVREISDIEKVEEAFKTIIDFNNAMSRKPQETAEILVDCLESTHRTLQQSTVSSMIQALVYYADVRSDARNEYSVITCKAIKEFLESSNLSYKGEYKAPLI